MYIILAIYKIESQPWQENGAIMIAPGVDECCVINHNTIKLSAI